MFPFKLKVISRHPAIRIDNRKYFKLGRITGLRFRLDYFFRATSIRIKAGGVCVLEEPICYDKKTDKISNSLYINLWFELPESIKDKAILKIELKYFIFYFRALKLNIIHREDRPERVLLLSDAYIDRKSLMSFIPDNKYLVKEINTLPSIVRPMTDKKISRDIVNILILRIDQLGDLILTVPAIMRLKNLFPNAALELMASPANISFAKSLEIFSEIIEIPFSFIKNDNRRVITEEIKKIVFDFTKSKKYDLAVDLSIMPESRELLGIICSDYKVGFENVDSTMLDLGILIHAKDPINQISNLSHSAYPLLIVEAIGLALRPKSPHFPLNLNKSRILAEFELQPKKYTVIHAGSRNILARWPLVNFVTLALEIVKKSEKVIFFSDDPIPLELRNALFQSNVSILDQDKTMSFEIFDIILSFARVFIGNDTGPKHLAAMRGVPVVAVHAARINWSEWGQIDSGYTISRRVPCAGCGIVAVNECGRDLVCLKAIAVDEVFSVYNEII